MAEKDSLSNFDFNKVGGGGKFLKFKSGVPVTVRVLTKDPVVQEKEFTSKTGEVNLSTKFCFIVWNWTEEKAQILSASPKMAKTFQNVATDEDFGANLQACDIKISPEGEMLERTYDINVLRHSGSEKPLTGKMVAEAKEIDLDKDVQDNKGRLSSYDPVDAKPSAADTKTAEEETGVTADDITDEPIDLNDIPF